MSFDKAIEHKKTKRKQYRGAKLVDCSCRNHGGCPWCEGNRLYGDKVREEEFREKLREFKTSSYL